MRLGKDEVARVINEIRDNRKKLDNCSQHDFSTQQYNPLQYGYQLECRNCGGKMAQLDVINYCRGFKAAGGDPLTVWRRVPL